MLYTTMKNKWTRVIAAAVGAVIYALGVNLFLVPLNLYTGGIMGVCQLIRTLVYQALGVANGYDFSGILYYALNIPIFLLAFTGNATMWMAVFADVGTALIVVANGLRAARTKA